MSEGIIKFEISQNELENLIYGLQAVQREVSSDDDLEISIDFDKGVISTHVKPRGDYKFDTEY